jgi:hypothetical protein
MAESDYANFKFAVVKVAREDQVKILDRASGSELLSFNLAEAAMIAHRLGLLIEFNKRGIMGCLFLQACPFYAQLQCASVDDR